MRNYLIAALMAGTLAAPAFAQAAPSQGGFRVEGLVGYDNADLDGNGSSGVLYGFGVGYDFQVGNAILGIEAEATDSTTEDCINAVVVAADELCVRAGRDLYAGGRVGFVVGSSTVLFAKAGYTNGRVNVDYEDGTSGTINDFRLHSNLDGVRVGAGAQFSLSPNTYIRTEYRYSNYEQGFDRHQVVGGFGFRF